MAINFAFKISAASGDVDFRVISFTAREWISKPFLVTLELASKNDIDFDDVLAKNALLTISSTYDGDTKDRYFHGIIQEFEKINYNNTRKRFIYNAVLVPNLWRLSLRKGYRIFQELPVLRKKDNSSYTTSIVEEILSGTGIGFTPTTDLKTQTLYPARDYCAQYNETDLNFISRLLEDEGIFYYFEHTDTNHHVIFGDNCTNYNLSIGHVQFHEQTGTLPDDDYVYNFRLSRQMHSGRVTLRDFDFAQPAATRLPEASLDIQDGDIIKSKASEGDSSANPPAPPKFQKFLDLEEYNYPGSYVQYDSNATPKDGVDIYNHLDDSRLDEAAIYRDKATGKSVCARFCPGFTFTITGHDEFDDNDKDSQNNEKDYVLTEVIHTGSNPLGSGETTFSNTFKGIPATVTFRPERKTQKGVVRGPQTAIVVDANGNTEYNSQDPQVAENIFTDSFGRVKVRFHWERPHKENNIDKWNNTAWVRVSQAWAGQGWGSMHIPHVGQEVIVDFLDGDPDRPIITGRVYNGENMPHNVGAADTMNPSVDPHISGFRDEYGNKLLFDANSGREKVVLKSPNYDSYLSLGKDGAELKTNADVAQRVMGNIIEAGCGTKFEAVFGLDLATKLAQLYEFVFGQKFEFLAGNKIAFGFGTEFEYKLTKDLKAVQGDIEHECKKDYKLTAGDGLCIVGGTKDTQSKNRSVFSSFADGMVLSFGPEKGTDTARADLGKLTWGVTGVATLLGIISAVLAKAFDATGEGTDVDEFTFGDHSFSTLTTVIALTQTIISTLMGYSLQDSVEPSYHEDPLAILGINNNGITLGIKPDLQMAKNQLTAISNQIKAAKAKKKKMDFMNLTAAGKELNLLKDKEKDIWKDFIKESLGPDTATKSKMVMKEDGLISINSDGDVKKITMSVGLPGAEDAAIIIRQTEDDNSPLNGITLVSDRTTIRITKGGNISLDTSGNNKDIMLKAGTGNVIITASEAQIAGSTFSKTAGATIARNLQVQK